MNKDKNMSCCSHKYRCNLLFLVMLFWGQHITALIAGLLFVIVATACSKIPPKMPSLVGRLPSSGA